MTLTNGATSGAVFWAPTTGASLGTYTTFVGTILAGSAAITTGANDNILGRLISESGAVTISGGADTYTVSPTPGATLNYQLMATLTYAGPTVNYHVAQYPNWYQAPSASSANVLYTVGSTNLPFALKHFNVPNVGPQEYYQYSMPEIVVPQSTTATANIILGIMNASSLQSSPIYWINETNGNNNDLQYQSSQGFTVKAPVGFRTERGSEVGSISTTSVTYDMAKAVDTLQFLVGPASSHMEWSN